MKQITKYIGMLAILPLVMVAMSGNYIDEAVAQSPEGYATTSTEGFPVGIIYAMAAMAAIGGGAIFLISNRKLEAEAGQTEQTGIDPSRLRAYQTSAGSGAYQTVRGEAQLIDDTCYEQTRSVYDEQKPEEPLLDTDSAPHTTVGGTVLGTTFGQ